MRRLSGLAGGILLIVIIVLLLTTAPTTVTRVQAQGLPTPTPRPVKGQPGGAPETSPAHIPDIELDGRLQFIEFYADWCGPCIDMKPNVDRMEGRYSPMVRFWRIDVDARESSRLEAYFGGVPAIPLLIVLDAQGAVLVRMEGFQSERQLDRLLRDLFAQTGTQKPERIDPPAPDTGTGAGVGKGASLVLALPAAPAAPSQAQRLSSAVYSQN